MAEELEKIVIDTRDALEEGAREAVVSALEHVHPADIAEAYSLLDDEQRSQLIFMLPARLAAETIAVLDEAERGEAVDDLDQDTLTEIVSELPPDDAADFLGDLTDVQREEVLDHMPDEQSDQLEELLEHDEESAGGIMTPELVAMSETATVGEAIEQVRRMSEDEEIHYVYTIGADDELTGIVPLRRLVIHPRETPLAAICTRDPAVVRVDDDQEFVANQIRKYDISAIPVVDNDGRLVGRVTHDDILDVADEEAAEDLYYMAGTEASELEEPSVARAAYIRLRWLVFCLVGTAVSGLIVAFFKDSFSVETYTALFLFVPMMGAMGGNSGIQISTIVVRSLATGDLASLRVGRALAREVPITLIMAPICGVCAGLIALVGVALLEQTGNVGSSVNVIRLATAVGIGMTSGIITAGVLGMTLPHLFRRIGVDPAIASGPIVTTANDIISVGLYFVVGLAFLG